jgi:pimeloyl-ACP methyl ester carboxylesterase
MHSCDTRSEQKTRQGGFMAEALSPFKSSDAEAQYLAAYDRVLSEWPIPFEAAAISTPFGNTHAIVSGPPDASPMVLLHGNFASATMWRSNIADLSCSRRVYALDIIGNLGKSRAVYRPRTRLDYAEWLEAVFSQLGLAQAAVVGLSYGAFLALNLAIYAPGLVTHLVMLSPDLPLAPLAFTGLLFGTAMTLFPTRWTVSQFLQRTSVKGYQANDPYLEQRIIGNTQARSLWHLRPRFTKAELRSLTTRTLALWGEKEILWNPKTAMECARRLWPDLEVDIMPNCGHALNRDDPFQVDARILEFIEN